MSLRRLPLRTTPTMLSIVRVPQTSSHSHFIQSISPALRQPPLLLPSLQSRLISQQHKESLEQPQSAGNSHTKPKPEPSWPQIKVLDDMGASRGVKIFIVVCLSIYGTMETIFYAKAIHRYFYPPEDVEVLED